MSTWARTLSGDLLLPTIGQGATALVSDPVQCAAIRINDGLQMWLGEWQLDLAQGTPWQSAIGQKNPNLVALSSMLRAAILRLGAPTVVTVQQLSLQFFRSVRDLQYSFQAIAKSGAKILGGSLGPAGVPYVVVQ